MDKKERHEYIMKKLGENPFLKDDNLAQMCGVSVATIRLDRAELGIAQYRERIRTAAKEGLNIKTGEVLDLNLYHNGISVLETNSSMLFEGTEIVKSQFIYAFAENLALSVVNAKAALIKVANVKYITEVHSGERLIARSEVIREKEKDFIVHVFIKANMTEVFRGKFSLAVQD